jgi:hypothetical protein
MTLCADLELHRDVPHASQRTSAVCDCLRALMGITQHQSDLLAAQGGIILCAHAWGQEGAKRQRGTVCMILCA